MECDVTDQLQVDAVMDRADAIGGVRVMVTNAGVFAETDVAEFDDEEYQVSRLLRAALDRLRIELEGPGPAPTGA